MTIRLPVLLSLLVAAAPVSAETLYKCQNSEGRIVYTNQKSGRNCEIVAQDKPVSMSMPGAGQKPRQPTPADFPRVNTDQQKARDSDRRAILEQELGIEQKNLADARQGAQQDKVQLHERNIESIRRELANLK